MLLLRIFVCLPVIAFLGCNRIKVEELPCTHNPEKICREQVKRLVQNKWVLDGWEVDSFGDDDRFTAYRAGEFKFSEGVPSHAKWFTRAKAKDIELTVVELDSSKKTIVIQSGDKKVRYQINLVEDDLSFVFRLPHEVGVQTDTLFRKSSLSK